MKKCRFFVKGRKEEHRTTLVKRDESERKEEEEREREFGDFEMISSKRSFSFLNFFPKALFLFLFSLALSESFFTSDAQLGISVMSSNSGVTPVIEKTYEPDEKNVNGLIQAGFPKEKAEKVLRAIGNENCCGPQIKWLFAHDLERNKARNELKKHESCFTSEHTDYDGYANVWGNQNKQPDAGRCCQSCKDYVPKAPNYYPCNVWVYCPKEQGCFAPAAGEFKYQDCWLKYQHDPIHVHVNMKGEYSAEYRISHPTAPEMVDWTAGVVLTEEEFHRSEGDLNHTWSARSHWRKLLADNNR